MKYFLYKLKTLKVHIVLMCIFAAASYPIFSAALSDYCGTYAEYNNLIKAGYNYSSPEVSRLGDLLTDKMSTTVFMGVIGAVALVAMFTIAIPILTKCFGYLTKKPLADMEMTALVTVRTRFFGSFFAGLAVYLVPHLIAVLIGSVITLPETGVRIVDNVNESYRRMMIYGLMMCVLFYCTTALIVAVCGRTKTTVIMTLFMNIAVPAITFSAGVLSFKYGFGLAEGLVDEMFGKVGWFTPLGLLLKFGVQGIFGTKSGGAVEIPQLLLFMLYCAVFAAAAYFLVKRRRHERTGSAFVYKHARHVFAATAVLAVTLTIAAEVILSLDDMAWSGVAAGTVAGIIAVDVVLWLVASFGFFCAFEFAGSRGEKHKGKRFILFAPFIIGSAAVTFLVTLTQGFGAAAYVPDESEILLANLDVCVGDIWYYSDGSTWFREDGYNTVDTALITGLHRDIISKNSAGSGVLDVSYTLKNGMNITRYYRVSDEFVERAFEMTKGAQSLQKLYGDNTVLKDTVTVIKRDRYYDNVIHCAENIPMKELADALNADCSALTFEQAKEIDSQSGRVIEIRYDYIDGSSSYDRTGYTTVWKTIFPIYKNTIAVLENYGISQSDLFG